MKFIKRLFGKRPQFRSVPPAKKRPPDWNLTISDLMDEMKAGRRKSIGHPELDWAREYEHSLIPEGVRYPQKGDVYESLENHTVSYMTAWSAPFTEGGEAALLTGELVWIDSDPLDGKLIGAYALAVEYDKLEQRMVPLEERESRKYGGFYFYFKTLDLNEKFKLVETGYEPDK